MDVGPDICDEDAEEDEEVKVGDQHCLPTFLLLVAEEEAEGIWVDMNCSSI